MVNKIRLEEIVFWIFIVIIIGTALWLLSGSPPKMNAIISIALAVAGSELMIWKTIFKIDKKTSIGFVEVGHDIEKIRININNRFDKIEDSLNKIENKIK